MIFEYLMGVGIIIVLLFGLTIILILIELSKSRHRIKSQKELTEEDIEKINKKNEMIHW